MISKAPVTNISITTGTMIRAALVIVGVLTIWTLRDLVLILLTAIVIASFVESAVPIFQKIKISRVFGIVLVYVFGLFFAAALFYLFAPLLITEIYNFSVALSSYVPGFGILDYFQSEAFSGAKDIVATLPHTLSFASLITVSRAFISNLSAGLIQTLSVAFGSMFNFVVIILISFYLSVQERGIEKFLRIIFPMHHEEYVVDLWERSRRKIALWVKGQLLLGLLVSVLIYLLLSLLGIQYALLLAIITGLMELVPYGILVALVPAIAFSYFSGGISSAILVAVSYFIIHEFEVFLLQPLVIKKVVGLSPIVIIISALAGFELAGVWGMVIAIPVAVFLVELANDVEKHKVFHRSQNPENEAK
jgi:predicted PurR-regulated permease PerM